MYIIMIDSGTTNSRIRLVDANSRVVDVVKKNVGIKNIAIDGRKELLSDALREGMKELFVRNHCKQQEVKYIVASGMITSNLGLYEVPYVCGPANLGDFAKGAKLDISPQLMNIPCIYIPGMKNKLTATAEEQLENIDQLDVMRGEEVETFGLLEQLRLHGKGMMVLPGSHTKFVMVDDRTITSCLSTLCGEAISVLGTDTILRDSLNKDLLSTVEKKFLLMGVKAAQVHGLTRALYHVRLMHLFLPADETERTNYFVGALIGADIAALISRVDLSQFDWLVIGGGNPLRTAFTTVFSELFAGKIIEATDEQVEHSTVIGAKMIGDLMITGK
ncbi:2-dehydro-3-deoxygalactonokinase [Caldibacillus lycopersici]|uniref:2-dehydro-3-deoxygalactonokinase n=1 Tax=Perspicuibacillus lycopersici TaxID=1325689 RepID=A0AAE3ITA2_9BACI|nr:2-dehydro-3-deoxygalactonokinase [Perspicuibacillus lycopersici]MCU9613054.1 2-dehydro-3-deoxygalactonokinase [Perspicuibacillus lycopersici]